MTLTGPAHPFTLHVWPSASEQRRPGLACLAWVMILMLAIWPASPVMAQQATASLRPVESGSIDAYSDSISRDMCLRNGLYILAFQRGTGEGMGVAAVGSSDAGAVASVTLTGASQDRWAWNAFSVDDYTCFRIGATNGRARVYLVRVGVRW